MNYMSRSLLLPSTGNILLDWYLWTVIKKYNYDNFDKLYIFVNSPLVTEDLIGDYKNILNDKKIVFLEPKNYFFGHVESMNHLIKHADTTHSCFIESDFFIYDKNILDENFKKVESGTVDYVGSPRGFCSQECLSEFRRINREMKFVYEDGSTWNFPSTDKWPAGLLWYCWWPCGFYAKTDLIKDDIYYKYPPRFRGSPIPELNGYIPTEEHLAYDTFGYAGLILNHKKYKFDICNLTILSDISIEKECSLHHQTFVDCIKNIDYRSVHLCNSSAFFNNPIFNGGYKNVTDLLSLNDPNAVKNIYVLDAFFNIFPHKNLKQYDILFKKHQQFLSDINDSTDFIKNHGRERNIREQYHTTYENIKTLSDVFQTKLLEKL